MKSWSLVYDICFILYQGVLKFNYLPITKSVSSFDKSLAGEIELKCAAGSLNFAMEYESSKRQRSVSNRQQETLYG